MNAFLEILDRVSQERWCVTPFCTTCGSRDYRIALRQMGSNSRPRLAESLSKLNLVELCRLREWDDALRIALGEISDAAQMDEVLSAWLPAIKQHVAVADIVLFYFVRRGALFAPMSVEVLRMWMDACVELACETHNESLVESLVYTLGRRVESSPELQRVVTLVSGSSQKVRLAVERSCGGAQQGAPADRLASASLRQDGG